MSDIPKARGLLHEIERMTNLQQIRAQVRRALFHMVRAPRIRRAPSKPTNITPQVRKYIFKLARTDHTIHEIANLTGVRNTGRISEVLNGKR